MGAPPFRVGSWTKALPASGGGFRVLCLNILSAERNDCAPIKSIGSQRGRSQGYSQDIGHKLARLLLEPLELTYVDGFDFLFFSAALTQTRSILTSLIPIQHFSFDL